MLTIGILLCISVGYGASTLFLVFIVTKQAWQPRHLQVKDPLLATCKFC